LFNKNVACTNTGEICKEALSSRSLRSGFVTECLNQGNIGLHEIRKLTNHSSFKSLEDYAIGVSTLDSPAAKIF